ATAVVGGADELAGDIGGDADRDDAVPGGGVEGLPVGGDRDVVSCDGDGPAGRVGGGGADRDDAVPGGGVEGLPVGGDRDVVSCEGDGLGGRVSGGADRGDRVRARNVEGLSVRGDRHGSSTGADRDRMARYAGGRADRGHVAAVAVPGVEVDGFPVGGDRDIRRAVAEADRCAGRAGGRVDRGKGGWLEHERGERRGAYASGGDIGGLPVRAEHDPEYVRPPGGGHPDRRPGRVAGRADRDDGAGELGAYAPAEGEVGGLAVRIHRDAERQVAGHGNVDRRAGRVGGGGGRGGPGP